jgi:hypothetical protein
VESRKVGVMEDDSRMLGTAEGRRDEEKLNCGYSFIIIKSSDMPLHRGLPVDNNNVLYLSIPEKGCRKSH